MKATVIVTLKPTVLDPQGMTIQRSLGSLGLDDITDVRQGKIFDDRLKILGDTPSSVSQAEALVIWLSKIHAAP